MDGALSAATSLLYPKGLENVVLASRARHAETVEAAQEARDAYLKRVRHPPLAAPLCCARTPASVPFRNRWRILLQPFLFEVAGQP